MQILSFLLKICRDENEWIPRRTELLDQSLVHLAGHPTHRLLFAEKRSKVASAFREFLSPNIWRIHVEDQIEVLGYLFQFVKGRPASVDKRYKTLFLQDVEILINAATFQDGTLFSTLEFAGSLLEAAEPVDGQ